MCVGFAVEALNVKAKFLKDNLCRAKIYGVPDPNMRKAAIIAQYTPGITATKSLFPLVRSLQNLGYSVIVVSSCDISAGPGEEGRLEEKSFQEIRWVDVDVVCNRPNDVVLVCRPNEGYDFGSWAAAFYLIPQLLDVDFLLQVNDSIVGPFWGLDAIVENFENSYGDIWGLVRSRQHFPHLQSYFVGYKRDVLKSAAFSAFWSSVRPQKSKRNVIDRYELGLSSILRREGFVSTCFLDGLSLGSDYLNPIVDLWDVCLARGVPFLKYEVIRKYNKSRPGYLQKYMKDKYGIDMSNWVESDVCA